MIANVRTLIQKLARHGNAERARHAQRFFKTRKGQYGEGDRFLGIPVPTLRMIARQSQSLSVSEVQHVLRTSIHEQRMVALLIWTYQFARKIKLQSAIYNAYVRNSSFINNWDLIDVTCPHIVGAYLCHRSRKPLYRFAISGNLWKKRIAIISTFAFIRNGEYKDTLAISKILLGDNHDLIHKAVGWMLREVGKRDKKTEVAFLKKYASQMPRTMLRYAIEKFPKAVRLRFLKA